MNDQKVYNYPQNNGMAIASFIIGIISWLLFIILLCLNYIILPLFTLATLGAGAVFYVCTLAVGCLSPLGWLIGTIFGYTAKGQIAQAGRKASGLENAGYIINLVGLGLTLLGICGFIAYVIFVGGMGFLDQMQYQY